MQIDVDGRIEYSPFGCTFTQTECVTYPIFFKKDYPTPPSGCKRCSSNRKIQYSIESRSKKTK